MENDIKNSGNFDLDLDALVAKPKTVRYKDKTITINQPTVDDVVKLTSLSIKIGKTGNDINELTAFVADTKKLIYDIVPDLDGAELTVDQLLAMVELISDSAKTKEEKELEKNNVEAENPKKKID